jgi:uncharacterized protein YndB with AHSA1/START domain
MTTNSTPKARVSIIVRASPAEIISAFVEPEKLTGFWLSSSDAPLAVGTTVHWKFMVPGAEIDTTATALEPGRRLAWSWPNGTTVDVELEKIDGATAVTVVNAGFKGTSDEIVNAALDATEGFALVLADLKTMLESGTSAKIVRDKARLTELRH